MHDHIAQIAEQAIAGHVFPGCVIGVIRAGQRTILPFGHLTYETVAPAVQADTFYDVASLTKSIPTAAVILRLVDQGRLHLDSRVIDYLPEIGNDYRDQILLKHLLTYTVVLDIPEGLS